MFAHKAERIEGNVNICLFFLGIPIVLFMLSFVRKVSPQKAATDFPIGGFMACQHAWLFLGKW